MLSAITGVGARFAIVAVNLVTVPMILGYLGPERYGVWVTVTALATWFAILQFGIAPAVIQVLSAMQADSPTRQSAVAATAWWVGVGMSLLAAVPLAVLFILDPWMSLFNVSDGAAATDARNLAVAVWAGAALSIPLGVPVAVLRAEQRGYVANILEIGAGVVRVGTVVVVVLLDLGSLALGTAWAGSGLLIGLAAMAFRASSTLAFERKRFDRTRVLPLLRVGASFMAVTLAALVITATDAVVISQLIGPAAVPRYSVPFLALMLFLALELAVLDALWPANREALAMGDVAWVRLRHRRVVVTSSLVALAFAVGLIVAGERLVLWWAGADAVPPRDLLVVFGGIMLVQAVELPHGRLLIAFGDMRWYTTLGLLNAAINLALSIALAPGLGLVGVGLGTLGGYIVTMPPLLVRARRLWA